MVEPSSRAADGEGVEYIYEEDGSVTAWDIETGVASFGDTKAEALRMLADALDLHEGRGEPIENPDEFLREELGIDPEEVEAARQENDELPEFMQ